MSHFSKTHPPRVPRSEQSARMTCLTSHFELLLVELELKVCQVRQ